MVAPKQRGFVLGRYVLYDEIASGGMASVHFARLIGDAGFSRTVAVKRLHGHLASDADAAAMFEDEARLAARVRHPNVVSTLDVVAFEKELFLVMDYVPGEVLSKLLRTVAEASDRVPLRIASAILVGTLHGLDAAHRAKSERGEPLDLVHRDVSPQNILVGADGIPRVLDFGIAKAIGRVQTTNDGRVKGKAGYLAPEQLRAGKVDSRTDVYAASVVLWETLTCQRLFAGPSPEATINLVLERTVPPPSTVTPEVPEALDALVLRGLARDPNDRFLSAREMAAALEKIVAPATSSEIGEWVAGMAGEALRGRASTLAEVEKQPSPIHTTVGAPAESSSISQAIPESAGSAVTARPFPRSVGYLAIAVAAMAVVVATWTVFRAGRSPSATLATPLPSSSMPMTTGSSPTADVERSPAPSSASATSGARRGPVHGGAPARRPAVRPAARTCDPPYLIDANGFRSPKSECL